MDTLPNEVIRMFFEHLNHEERMRISRTCYIWAYLMYTFPKVLKGYEYSFSIESLNVGRVVVHHNDNIITSSDRKINVFDARGNSLFNFSSAEDGQFDNCCGVTVDLNNNNRIQVFDEKGKFMFKFGSSGTADGQFFLSIRNNCGS